MSARSPNPEVPTGVTIAAIQAEPFHVRTSLGCGEATSVSVRSCTLPPIFDQPSVNVYNWTTSESVFLLNCPSRPSVFAEVPSGSLTGPRKVVFPLACRSPLK